MTVDRSRWIPSTRVALVRVLRTATLLFLVGGPGLAQAHEIPSDVTVRMFLKPTGKQLDLLVPG